jgi:hypothetical protein
MTESIWDKIKTVDLGLDRYAKPVSKPRDPTKETVHPTRTCKAVLKRLRALGHEIDGPDEHWRVRNLHTGCHQRACGAWSWALEWAGPDGPNKTRQIGGYHPASECAKEGATLDQDQFGHTSLLPPGY